MADLTTYRDFALAAYAQRLADEALAEEQAKQTLIARARTSLIPLFTDADGKVVLDPVRYTKSLYVDLKNVLVILVTTDSSAPVYFAVYPDRPDATFLASQRQDGTWQSGQRVASLADVGEALTDQGLPT